MANLNGKIALVTGASRGIGAAIVRRLTADGAHVHAVYNAAEDAARALAEETGATLIQADLGTIKGIDTVAASVEGTLDILVNNAGIATFTAWGEVTPALVDREFAINVRAPLLLTQSLGPRINDGGRIVFVSSIVARRAFGGGAIVTYAATKGAVDTLVLQLAPVFGPRHVTVNAIAPGAIDTEMSGWLREEGGEAQAHAIQAIPRLGLPDDIADTVAFLASSDARWVTGQTIQAGGGTLL